MINGLDLFSGIGGITLALDPWVRPLAYCENDKFCQSVLLSRQADGAIPVAPIWDDIKTFPASSFVGSIDVIYGGFPCQDISIAGPGCGLEGERSGLFWEACRLVKEINPAFVFLENVPAIRTRGLREVIRAFTDMGYDCRWTRISAREIGAPHLRQRWFMLAYSQLKSLRNEPKRMSGRRERGLCGQREALLGNDGKAQFMADSRCEDFKRRECQVGGKAKEGETPAHFGSNSAGQGMSWWAVEPDVGGAIDGLSPRMDKNGGLDNAEESEIRARTIMRMLRNGPGSKTLEWAVRGLDHISAQEILLAFVRQYENDCWESWEVLESPAPSEECLRKLRIEALVSGSSLRRGPIEQFFREYPDALRELSRMVASQGQTPWSCPLWESGTPRTEKGVRNRAVRLRALGNSVVPAQARKAFKRLIGIEEE